MIKLFFWSTQIGTPTGTQVFPSEICKILENTFLTEHFWATASILKKNNKMRLYLICKLRLEIYFFYLHSIP